MNLRIIRFVNQKPTGLTVHSISNKYTVYCFGSNFNPLGKGTSTLSKHPNSLKYLKLDIFSFHNSYGIDCVFRWGTLLSILLVVRMASPQRFRGEPKLIIKVFIISFNVLFFRSAKPFGCGV